MNQVAIYSTDKLSSDTSFLNQFLDDLIENYCDKKFGVDSVVQVEQIPTLDRLIINYYPGYYRKSPGLYANLKSTDVKLVYEPEREEVLLEALEHKLSRYILPIDVNSIPLLKIANRESFRGLPRRSFLETPILSNNSASLFNWVSSFYQDLSNSKIRGVIGELSADLVEVMRPKVFVYKPSANSLHSIISQTEVANENLIRNQTSFLQAGAAASSFCIRFAFILTKKPELFRDCFSEPFTTELLKRADVVMADFTRRLTNEVNFVRDAKRREEEQRQLQLRLEEEARKERARLETERILENRRYRQAQEEAARQGRMSQNSPPVHKTMEKMPTDHGSQRMQTQEDEFKVSRDLALLGKCFFGFVIFLSIMFLIHAVVTS